VVFYHESWDTNSDTLDLQGHTNSKLLMAHASSTRGNSNSSSLQEMPFENLNGIFRAHIGDVERQLLNAFPPPGSVTEVPHPVLSPIKTPMPPAPRKGRQSRRLKHTQTPAAPTTGGVAQKSESQLKLNETVLLQETSHLPEDVSPLCNLVLPTPEKQRKQWPGNVEPQFTAALDVEMSTPRPLGK
jgi:hypothetical protein